MVAVGTAVSAARAASLPARARENSCQNGVERGRAGAAQREEAPFKAPPLACRAAP